MPLYAFQNVIFPGRSGPGLSRAMHTRLPATSAWLDEPILTTITIGRALGVHIGA